MFWVCLVPDCNPGLEFGYLEFPAWPLPDSPNELQLCQFVLSNENLELATMPESSSIKIRKCLIEDLEILHSISEETFFEAFAKDNSQHNFEEYIKAAFSKKQVASELRNPLSQFYFAFSQDRLAGYIKLNFGRAQTDLADQDGMELERIYVLSKFQNQRIGKRLLDFAIDIARSEKVNFIWLEVWEANTQAIRFYERGGFRHSGFHPFKLGDEDQTDYIMKLQL